jgi:hypothetical protein
MKLAKSNWNSLPIHWTSYIRCRHLLSWVPVGAGYGHIILNLARDKRFLACRLMAGEYVASGIKLIDYLSRREGIELEIGHCDLGQSPMTDLKIPPGAVIFTSFAATYKPEHSIDFVDALLSLRPKAVVHFEPLLEHCDISTLLGALQYKYIMANDYNRNLLSILKDAEKSRRINIIHEQSQVHGLNPLLPFSIVAWQPTRGENMP